MQKTVLWENLYRCEKPDGTFVKVVRSKATHDLTPEEWEAYRADLKAEFIAQGCSIPTAARAAATPYTRMIGKKQNR